MHPDNQLSIARYRRHAAGYDASARRTMALITALVFAIGFAFSAPATWDFVSFKAIRSSDVLGIRLDIVFFCYMIFLAGTITHYLLRAYRLARGDSLATLEKEESL